MLYKPHVPDREEGAAAFQVHSQSIWIPCVLDHDERVDKLLPMFRETNVRRPYSLVYLKA